MFMCLCLSSIKVSCLRAHFILIYLTFVWSHYIHFTGCKQFRKEFYSYTFCSCDAKERVFFHWLKSEKLSKISQHHGKYGTTFVWLHLIDFYFTHCKQFCKEFYSNTFVSMRRRRKGLVSLNKVSKLLKVSHSHGKYF